MSLALLAAAILGLGMFGPVLVRWSAPLLTTSTALLAGAGGAVLLPFALLLLDGCALLP